MERSRSTHKRGRRYDALRRTLRRQGVSFEQEGGARAQDWSLITEADPASVAAKAFLTEAFSGKEGEDFRFLTADGQDWRRGEGAAKRYATLIMRQDELLSLGLTKIRTALGITDETSDTELVDRVSSLDDPAVAKYIAVLQTLAEAVIQDSPLNGGKITYNLYPNTVQTPRQQLINILLYPTLMTNVLVNGIADVLKLLTREEGTYRMITENDATKRTIYHNVLADKYTWYIISYAASATNDTLKDSFCLWETRNIDSELKLKSFFKDFFSRLLQDSQGTPMDFITLAGTYLRKYKTEESFSKPSEKSDKITDTIVCSLISAIVLSIFKEGGNKLHCLEPFVQKISSKPELLNPPPPNERGTRSQELRPYQTAPTIQQLTGMLEDPTTWDQPIFLEVGDNLTSKITFNNLLYNLNPRHIHFLLHLVYVLFKPDETVAVKAGGAAGASSSASVEPVTKPGNPAASSSSSSLPSTEQPSSQGSPAS